MWMKSYRFSPRIAISLNIGAWWMKAGRSRSRRQALFSLLPRSLDIRKWREMLPHQRRNMPVFSSIDRILKGGFGISVPTLWLQPESSHIIRGIQSSGSEMDCESTMLPERKFPQTISNIKNQKCIITLYLSPSCSPPLPDRSSGRPEQEIELVIQTNFWSKKIR